MERETERERRRKCRDVNKAGLGWLPYAWGRGKGERKITRIEGDLLCAHAHKESLTYAVTSARLGWLSSKSTLALWRPCA